MALLAQFGFAAIAFYLVWMAYREINPKLIEVIRQNSQALTETAAALREVANSQKETHTRLGRFDDRLIVLEEGLRHGVRECPLGAGRKE